VERMCIMSAIIPPSVIIIDNKEVTDEADDMNPHQTLHCLNSIFHQYLLKVYNTLYMCIYI